MRVIAYKRADKERLNKISWYSSNRKRRYCSAFVLQTCWLNLQALENEKVKTSFWIKLQTNVHFLHTPLSINCRSAAWHSQWLYGILLNTMRRFWIAIEWTLFSGSWHLNGKKGLLYSLQGDFEVWHAILRLLSLRAEVLNFFWVVASLIVTLKDRGPLIKRQKVTLFLFGKTITKISTIICD